MLIHLEHCRSIPDTYRRYSLPEHLRAHVDYITPGVKHQVYKRSISKRDDSTPPGGISNLITIPGPVTSGPSVNIDVKTIPKNCSSFAVSTDCIRALYELPALNPNRSVPATNSLGKLIFGDCMKCIADTV